MLTQTIIENHERVYLCPINEYKKNLVYNKIALFFSQPRQRVVIHAYFTRIDARRKYRSIVSRINPGLLFVSSHVPYKNSQPTM